MPRIADAKILILATNGFEESELFDPRQTLLDAGASVTLASLDRDTIQGTVMDEKGRTIDPDTTIAEVDPQAYDALLLPGGVANPDKLRTDAKTLAIISAFDAAGKPIAAICHGPWLLVEADIIGGRTVTGWPSIRTDLKNAGGDVVDREVVIDGHIITSRQPEDIPAFTQALIAAIEAR